MCKLPMAQTVTFPRTITDAFFKILTWNNLNGLKHTAGIKFRISIYLQKSVKLIVLFMFYRVNHVVWIDSVFTIDVCVLIAVELFLILK